MKNHINANPVKVAEVGLVINTGKKKLRALTIATAIAALFTQHEIQYPQATKNPINSPKTILEYKYGPPFLSEISLLKLLKILAITNAPDAVKIHPKTLIPPNFARLAGKTKIPAPIIFPTIKDVAANKPIF